MKRRYCTVPWGMRDYWHANFNGFCQKHDNAYGRYGTISRYQADKNLFKAMLSVKTGNKMLNILFASSAFCILRTFGFMAWQDEKQLKE